MPILKVEDVAYKAFDYVVVGGGTAGLTLATRLSEDSSISVLVLEAGHANLHDPKIEMPGQFGQTLANPKYDWSFMTEKQKNSNDKQFLWSRGKSLGGSSTLNFYAWVKPPAEDIDAFERLGNPGWNWANYAEYARKVETFHLPAQEQIDLYPHTFDLDHRGRSGPIQVTIPPHAYSIDKLFQDTLVNKGAKAIKDPYGGDITGTWIASANLDPRTWKRSYAATAYLLPNIGRPNLNVLTEALVSRVIFDDEPKCADLIATVVEFLVADKIYTVKVNKEVIISAGAIKSPQVLELSGIGRPDVLSQLGIDIKVNLPGVGENVQEHVFFATAYELDSSVPHETLDLLNDPVYLAKAIDLYSQGKGIMRTGITSFAYLPVSLGNPENLSSIYAKAEEEVKVLKEKDVPGLAQQLDIQLEALRDPKSPDFELVAFPGLFSPTMKPEPGKSYVTLFGMINHPLSRGTIHSKSKDPSADPTIDPHYLEAETDLNLLVEQLHYIRAMRETEPWKSGVVCEVVPGAEVSTDEQVKDHIKNGLSSTWHTVGSCSMLPRDKQGVVDPKLKVYGTTNVRVADISIVPLHIAAHTQATAYVIGEKAADFIKADLPTPKN